MIYVDFLSRHSRKAPISVALDSTEAMLELVAVLEAADCLYKVYHAAAAHRPEQFGWCAGDFPRWLAPDVTFSFTQEC